MDLMCGVMTRTFNENLSFEQSAQDFFNNLYKDMGCEIVNRNDCKFWDLVLKKEKYTFKVEEKARRKTYDDILVETIQDTRTNSVGWIYYSKADFLIYGMFGDPVLVYRLNMPKFKRWFEDNQQYFSDIPSKDGWGNTVNKAIPIKLLSHSLIKLVYKAP